MRMMFLNYLKINLSQRKQKWTGVVVYYQEGDKAVKLTKGDQSNPKHFSYLYLTKAGAQQRLDREYALLISRLVNLQRIMS